METSPVAGGVSGTGQDNRQETHHEHAAIFGLNRATANGRESLALGLGLLLGLAVAPVIADYANADPSALWQAAGATAAFVAAFGAYGYATRRDLSAWEARCSGRFSA